MPFRPTLIRAISALAFGLLPAVTLAAPAETHLDFTVLRGGDPVGRHQIDLIRNGDGETVSIKTAVLVRVAYIPVYRFEHTGSEVWRNGRLISLRSQTNDDGDKHVLAAAAKDDHIEINGDGSRSQVDASIIPASLWNRELLTRPVLMNTLTGKQMAVSVTDAGEETIRSRGTDIRAHHYRITGELQRELWYDHDGTLVQIRFKAKDDSDILYVLG